MLLSQTAEYALRAMAHIVLVEGDQASRAKDVAAGTGVPLAYVSKVLQRMVLVGLLSSQKGHHGGFRLARPARQVRLLDILAAVDEMLLANRCIFGKPSCDEKHPCPLHTTFFPLKEAVLQWAERTTLEDVKLGATLTPPAGLPRAMR